METPKSIAGILGRDSFPFQNAEDHLGGHSSGRIGAFLHPDVFVQ